MLIQGLRYRDKQSEAFTALKVIGNAKVAVVKSRRAREIRDVIQYILRPTTSTAIAEGAIQLVDSAGDLWIVERSERGLRIARNGRRLDTTELSDTLLGAFFDQDIPLVGLQESSGKIEFAGGTRHFDVINSEIARCEERVRELMAVTSLARGETLVPFAEKAEPIFLANRELIKQRRILSATKDKRYEPAEIEKLRHEIRVLDKLADTAAPFGEPNFQPKRLREQIDANERELQRLVAECGMSALDLDRLPERWEKLTEVRARLEILQRLAESAEKVQTLFQEPLHFVAEGYLEALQSLLSNDQTMVTELESCLSTLKVSVDQAERGPTIIDLLGRFIRPSVDTTLSAEHRKTSLENARMAVDFTLGRLGELHVRLNSAEREFRGHQQEFDLRIEKVRDRLQKQTEQWNQLAKASAIPGSAQLKDLLALVTRAERITSLKQETDALRRDLDSFQARIHMCEELLIEYRRVTDSQHAEALSTPQIIISATQNLLRYREQKLQQLERIEKMGAESRAHFALEQYLQHRQKQIADAWSALFSEIEVPELSIDLAQWPQFFLVASELRAWKLLETRQPKSIRQSIGALGSCVVFHWDGDASVDLIAFAQEQLLRESFTLFVVSSDNVVAKLLDLGCSSIKMGQQKAAASRKVTLVPQKTTRVLDAESIMKLFRSSNEREQR